MRTSRLAALAAAATVLGPISIAGADDASQAVTIEVSAAPRTLEIRTNATIAADGTISADGTVSGDPNFPVQLSADLDSITQGKPGFTPRVNLLTSLRLENPSGQGDAKVSVEHVGAVGEAEGDDTALGGFRITVRVETDGEGLWTRPVLGPGPAAVSLIDGASGDILTDIQEFTGVRGAQLRVTLFHTSGEPVPTGPVAITRTHRYVIADGAA